MSFENSSALRGKHELPPTQIPRHVCRLIPHASLWTMTPLLLIKEPRRPALAQRYLCRLIIICIKSRHPAGQTGFVSFCCRSAVPWNETQSVSAFVIFFLWKCCLCLSLRWWVTDCCRSLMFWVFIAGYKRSVSTADLFLRGYT